MFGNKKKYLLESVKEIIMIVNVIVFSMEVVCLLSRIKTLLNKQLFQIDLLDKSKNQILEESKNQISTEQTKMLISVISLISVYSIKRFHLFGQDKGVYNLHKIVTYFL